LIARRVLRRGAPYFAMGQARTAKPLLSLDYDYNGAADVTRLWDGRALRASPQILRAVEGPTPAVQGGGEEREVRVSHDRVLQGRRIEGSSRTLTIGKCLAGPPGG